MLLLDTHFLVWAAHRPERISATTQARITDPAAIPAFSTVSIWEVALKAARPSGNFRVDAAVLRRGLLRGGYREIAMTGEHAVATMDLPRVHGDPFDRILVAQARVEGAVLLTADAAMARYGAPVELAL